MIDLVPYIVIGLLVAAVPLTIGAAIVKHRRDKGAAKPEAAPAPVTEDEPRCPCGRPATRPLPRFKVWELPVLGRLVTRERDTFGAPVVCDAHAEVASTVIDEHVAAARLMDAQAQRAKITALANSTADTLGAVVATLPEDRQKAYARSLRPTVAVRALPRADDGAEEKAS